MVGLSTPISENDISNTDYAAVIVGAGLYGLTMAERITSSLGLPVLIVDRRDHIGGNAHSYMDEVTGIEVHKYGPHIFHTSNSQVWDYVRRFTDFNHYRHHVWAEHQGELFSLPISLATMSQFWGKRLTPNEARQKVAESRLSIPNPENFEEKALATIGRELYEAFFEGYTRKQWQTDPKELPKSVFGRLPVRFNLNTRYFDDDFEGIPTEGYGAWMENMISSELIHVLLDADWFSLNADSLSKVPLIYTGPIDEFFGFTFGRLGWRTLDFTFERHGVADYQGAAQINFPEVSKPFTRSVEYRHFHPELRYETGASIVSTEFARFAGIGDEPFYPINSYEDREKLERYRELAKRTPSAHFGGRLGSYQYLDMHMAVASALSNFESKVLPRLLGG